LLNIPIEKKNLDLRFTRDISEETSSTTQMFLCTCPDASGGDEDGVAEAEDQRAEVQLQETIGRQA
jgi:hypothetical protein